MSGWYADPTGRHQYRWWSNGWREHVADGSVASRDPLRPKRFQIGAALMAQLALVPFVVFFFIGGTPHPVSRVGVTTESGVLQILNVACPEESLLGITLRRVSYERESATVLWSASGSVPLPERIDLGGNIPGLVTQTPLGVDIGPMEELSLRVTTSDLEGFEFALDFRVADVPSTGVLSFDGTFDTVDAYRAKVLADTPCEDPTGKNAAGRTRQSIARPARGLRDGPRARSPGPTVWSAARLHRRAA